MATPVRIYTYLGDKLTREELKGATCRAVLDARGKCIRGRNSNMLVEFADGKRTVVVARMLRKLGHVEDDEQPQI